MSEVINVVLEEVSGYHYGNGQCSCDICGKCSEYSVVPAFTVQGEDYDEIMSLCDDCLVAGPEKAAERMTKHIENVAHNLDEASMRGTHYLSVLIKAKNCIWVFPEIDTLRQARKQADIDFVKDYSRGYANDE